MKQTPKIKFLFATAFYFVLTTTSLAGNGYYLGADYVKNSTQTNTITSTTFGITPTTVIVYDDKKTNSQDYGLRFGYRHKISKHLYIAPELFYQSLDTSYLYSTTMKAGINVKDFSIFGSLGYSEIDKFNNSSENFGGGIEYKINDNFSLNLEYIKFKDIKTSSSYTETTTSVDTDKTNKIQSIKFGITYYFHE